MAVYYKLTQEKRKNAKFKDYWYARAVHPQVVHTSTIADMIQRNCTVKKSDVVAVLTELVEVMQDELQNSNSVHLDGFGRFNIGISGKGAKDVKSYNSKDYVKSLHVNFQPETRFDTSKRSIRTFLTGCKLQEAPKNDAKAEEEEKEE